MVSQHTPISRALAHGTVTPGGAQRDVNVNEMERWFSLVGGGLLTAAGLREGGVLGLGLAALGGGLVYRGVTGHCPMYSALEMNTAHPHNPVASVAAGHGFKITQSIAVNRPAEQLYRLWRDLEGLPRFMTHLIAVKSMGKKSHWVARGPVGMQVEWDAEVINDEPGRLLAWRSLEESQVSTAGSVHFTPLSADRGTEVSVTLKYDPPAGKLGAWLAWLFGEEPSVQIREDLRRFKQLIETGEIARTTGQSSGRRSTKTSKPRSRTHATTRRRA